MILCERDAPEGHPGWCCVHLYACILSSSLTSVSIFSVCCYSIVSISMDHILQEFYTLFLTRFRTYKIASPPLTKMTSKHDIEGLVSLKFLRPWSYLCDVTPELLVGEEGLRTVRAHQPVRQLVVVQELHVLLLGKMAWKNGGNFKQFHRYKDDI